MSVVNEHPEFSFKLIPERGKKVETFIKYGNGLAKEGVGNTKWMGVDVKCSKILEVVFFHFCYCGQAPRKLPRQLKCYWKYGGYFYSSLQIISSPLFLNCLDRKDRGRELVLNVDNTLPIDTAP